MGRTRSVRDHGIVGAAVEGTVSWRGQLRRVGLWQAVGVAGIVAVAVLPYRATTAEVENVAWVEHTHRVLERIGEIEQGLSETQNARRGFALTGDAGELDLFTASASRLDAAEAAVRALTVDNPRQQDRLARLEPLLAACRGIQDAAIARRSSEGFALAAEAEATRHVEAIVVQVAPLLGELVAEEERLLVERDRRVADGVVYARWVHVLGTGASVAVLLLAFAALRRENTRRRRSELAAQRSEARFARLADSGIVGIAFCDVSGTFTEANDAFLDMIGHSQDELRAGELTAKGISPATLQESDGAALRTLVETGVAPLREKEYVRSDGARVPVLVAGAMVNPAEAIAIILDITDRHRVEQALRVSQVRFRRLMESGIMGVVVSDTDGHVTEANDAFLAMVGYSQEDLREGRVSGERLNTPERDATDAVARAQLASQGFASPWEKELLRKDGTRVSVLMGVALLDAPNSIALVVDLTEQRKAQELVRHLREERTANALFRDLLESAPDAMVIVDAQGLIAVVNAQAEKLFGYTREEMLGKPASTMVPSRALDEHQDRWKRYYGDERLRRMGDALELVGLRKDGTEIAIEVRHSPLQTDQGVLVSTSIRDITARRKAEATLRASEERYRLLVESVKDYAIFMLDPQGRVTSWNEGAERIKGWTADEIIGQSFARLYPADQQDRPAQQLLTATREGRVEDEGFRVRKDGSRFWANTIITAVHDERGTLVGFAKVTRDLSERRRAEEALVHANRELEAFSYSVAHDLRGPLRGMNGFAQVLLDTYADKLDAQGREWLELILHNARRMGALIDALLSLARVTRKELHRSPVDLAAVVRAAVAQMAKAEPERSVELVVPEHVWADADPNLLRALVENLLGNAWKFTRKVGAARIEVGIAGTDGPDGFFVRDNGAGFDMAYANKLFGAFQRLHTDEDFLGTGIGLATVQRIVQRHGGRVWAEGVVDHGATFFFTLPATARGSTTP